MDGIAAVLFFSIVLFLFGIIAHEVEEIVFQHKWVQKNAPALKQRFPKLEKVFDHLLTMDTKAFAFAVLEEAIVIVLAIYLPLHMNWTDIIPIGIFLAYTLHLLVHIIQGIIFHGYIPGLVTACITFPIYAYVIYFFISISNYSSYTDAFPFILAGLAGSCFLLLNLLFSHWIGKKISSLF